MPYRNVTDEELIRRYQQGEQAAFEELCRRYYQYVYTIFISKKLNAEDARDLTQDVFVKLITKLIGFKFQAKFKTYLFRAVRNHFLDYLKGKRKNQVSWDEAIENEENLVTKPAVLMDPVELENKLDLENHELQRIISFCIQSFKNHKIRSVILLKIMGLSLIQIESLTGLKLTYVNSIWTKNKTRFWLCVERHYRIGFDPI